MADRNRTFAAGLCDIDGLGCPIKRSGFELGPNVRIAHYYDKQINELTDDDLLDGYSGARVGEDYAKPAFLDAIDALEADGEQELAERARAIAVDLGWLDE
jgi:hypothetical protein